jgi:hypothetical protein
MPSGLPLNRRHYRWLQCRIVNPDKWASHALQNSEPKPAHAVTYLACLLFIVFWMAVVCVTTFKP